MNNSEGLLFLAISFILLLTQLRINNDNDFGKSEDISKTPLYLGIFAICIQATIGSLDLILYIISCNYKIGAIETFRNILSIKPVSFSLWISDFLASAFSYFIIVQQFSKNKYLRKKYTSYFLIFLNIFVFKSLFSAYGNDLFNNKTFMPSPLLLINFFIILIHFSTTLFNKPEGDIKQTEDGPLKLLTLCLFIISEPYSGNVLQLIAFFIILGKLIKNKKPENIINKLLANLINCQRANKLLFASLYIHLTYCISISLLNPLFPPFSSIFKYSWLPVTYIHSILFLLILGLYFLNNKKYNFRFNSFILIDLGLKVSFVFMDFLELDIENKLSSNQSLLFTIICFFGGILICKSLYRSQKEEHLNPDSLGNALKTLGTNNLIYDLFKSLMIAIAMFLILSTVNKQLKTIPKLDAPWADESFSPEQLQAYTKSQKSRIKEKVVYPFIDKNNSMKNIGFAGIFLLSFLVTYLSILFNDFKSELRYIFTQENNDKINQIINSNPDIKKLHLKHRIIYPAISSLILISLLVFFYWYFIYTLKFHTDNWWT